MGNRLWIGAVVVLLLGGGFLAVQGQKNRIALQAAVKSEREAVGKVAALEKKVADLEERLRRTAASPPKSETVAPRPEGERRAARERVQSLSEKARQEAEHAQKLEEDMAELNRQLARQKLEIQRTKDQLRINIVDRILFGSGSARIRKEGREALDKIATFLKAQEDRMVRVEGHTDDQAIGGKLRERYPTNWELSADRAVSVVRYLESKGVPPSRLSATGYSFHQPVADNKTPEGRAKNRRIVILLSRVKPPR